MEWFRSVLRDTDTMRNELRTNPPLIRPLRGLDRDVLLGDELLSAVDTPVSLQWGTHDPMGGAETARTFARRLPRADLVLWFGAGHAPWMDDPERAAAATTVFLAG